MANFEYRIVDAPIGLTDDLQHKLTVLGSLGWEAVGYTCIIQLGTNAASVLLKRATAELPAPLGAAHGEIGRGWHRDPAGRHEQRYHDGIRWTEHVTGPNGTAIDYPNVRD